MVLGQVWRESRCELEGPLFGIDGNGIMGKRALMYLHPPSAPDLDTLVRNAHSGTTHRCSLPYDYMSCLLQYRLGSTHRKERADGADDGMEKLQQVPQLDSTSARD